MGAHLVQVQVLRDGELLLARELAPRRALTLGPAASAFIPTYALGEELALLSPTRGGYSLGLRSPLAGQVTVGARVLRIAEGLLWDPRPEPLLLTDGDSGRIRIDDELELCFTVHRVSRRFRARPQIDRGLALSLGLCALVCAATLCVVAPWRSGGRTRPGPEPRLRARPALALRLARIAPPRPMPGSSARAVTAQRQAPARARVRQVPAGPVAARPTGVLALLDGAARRPGRALPGERVDQLLASIAPGRGPGAGRAEPDLLGGLLARAAGPVAEPGIPSTSLALPEPGPVPRRAVAPDARGPSREEIREVVTRGGGQVRLCYERELISSARPLEGRILMRWVVDQAGRVMSVEILKDSVQSAELRRCVIDQVRAWVFPPCPSKCTVVYPFDFYPRMS